MRRKDDIDTVLHRVPWDTSNNEKTGFSRASEQIKYINLLYLPGLMVSHSVLDASCGELNYPSFSSSVRQHLMHLRYTG